MAFLGVKIGRHSLQTARWVAQQRRALPVDIYRQDASGASWRPTLGLHVPTGQTVWSHRVWDSITQLNLPPQSLLEHLVGDRVRIGDWEPDATALLENRVWGHLREIAEQDWQSQGAGTRHVVGVATTMPATPRLQAAVCATTQRTLGLELTPDRVWNVSVCAVAGWLRRPAAGQNETRGPLLHVHLGGKVAQVHLWDVVSTPTRLELHRMGGQDAPGGAVGDILSAFYAKATAEWNLLRISDLDPVAAANLRRHVIHHIAVSRPKWTTGWQYAGPAGYGHLASWRPGGMTTLTAAQVDPLFDAAGDALMAAIRDTLEAGNVAAEEVETVVATGAGASQWYLLPRLREAFPGRCSPEQGAETLPAVGAAHLAYYRGAADSGVALEIREGSMIGVELAQGQFDPLILEQGDGWGEIIRIYDVPPGVSEIRLRAGVRRVDPRVPALACLPVPPGLRGAGSLAVRVWREGEAWKAQAGRVRPREWGEPVWLRAPVRADLAGAPERGSA